MKKAETPRYDLEKPNAQQLEFIHRHWVPGIRTLADIGCGGGRYALHFASRGSLVTGFDRDRALLRTLTRRSRSLGLDVRTRPLDLDAPGFARGIEGRFDAILLVDILEHIKDDMGALGALRRKVNERVFLSVPRETPAALQEAGLCFGAYRDLTHLRYYTEARVEALAKKAGYRVVEITPMHEYAAKSFMPLLFDEKHLPSRILSRMLYGRTRLVRYRKYWNSVAAVLRP